MSGLTVRRSTSRQIQFTRRLTDVPVGLGIASLDDLHDEFLGYANILLGREDSPMDSPYLALQEVAAVFYARGCEVEMLIHEGERQGLIARGSPLYKFRTGSLRSFLSMSKMMADLGSRRLTEEQLLHQQAGS